MPMLFFGDDITVRSEVEFLRKLVQHLEPYGDDAIVFANFSASSGTRSRQIDFLLVIPGDCVWQIELKGFAEPVRGGEHGQWELKQGEVWKTIPTLTNPWKQALECKYAIVDDMGRFAKERANIPTRHGKWENTLESCACFYPELHSDSEVPGRDPRDFKAFVFGFQEFLQAFSARKRDPGWTREHWLEFAKWKGLKRQDDRDPLGSSEVSRLLDEYITSFKEVYGLGLQPLTPVTLKNEGKECLSDSCWELARSSEYTYFIGPSGCGKTHHLIHIALRSLSERCIPIFLNARDYDGNLSQLLGRGISKLVTRTSEKVTDAASKTQLPLVLIVDGLNECPRSSSGSSTSLLQELESFRQKHQSAHILVSSQSAVASPRQSICNVVTFVPLDQGQKQAMLATYATDELTSNQSAMAMSFSSAHDLTKAARAIQKLGDSPTRTSLYEILVKETCKTPSQYQFVRRCFVALAGEMRSRYRHTLECVTTFQIVETATNVSGATREDFDAVFQTGLLIESGNRYVFAHELIQKYFEALWLVRTRSDHEQLIAALGEARNLDICDFVVEIQDNTEDVLACLAAIAETKLESAVDIVVRCVEGEMGLLKQTIIEKEVIRVFVLAQRELAQFEIENHKATIFKPRKFTNLLQRTLRDRFIIAAIPRVIRAGRFIEELIHLAGVAVLAYSSAAENKTGAVLPEKLWEIDTQPSRFDHRRDQTLIAHDILRGALSTHQGSLTEAGKTWVNERIRLPQDLSDNEQWLCWSMISEFGLNEGSISFESFIPSFLEDTLRSNSKALRRWALRCAGGLPSQLSDTVRAGVRKVLQVSRAPELAEGGKDTRIKEFYGIPSPSDRSPEQAVDELMGYWREDLSDIEKDKLIIFISLYSEGWDGIWLGQIINHFPESDRLGILKFVSKYSGHNALGIVMYLLKGHLDDPEVQQIFIEFACSPPIFYADDAHNFKTAWTACANFLQRPPKRRSNASGDEIAWHLFGELIFWSLKEGDFIEEYGKIWRELRERFGFEAIDPFWCLSMEGPMINWPIGKSRNDVRLLLEFGLKHADRLSSALGYDLPDDRRGELIKFMICKLGEVGNAHSIEVLRPYLEHSSWAEMVRKSLRAISSEA